MTEIAIPLLKSHILLTNFSRQNVFKPLTPVVHRVRKLNLANIWCQLTLEPKASLHASGLQKYFILIVWTISFRVDSLRRNLPYIVVPYRTQLDHHCHEQTDTVHNSEYRAKARLELLIAEVGQRNLLAKNIDPFHSLPKTTEAFLFSHFIKNTQFL